MSIKLHWYLPTNGDGRTPHESGTTVAVGGNLELGRTRKPDLEYLSAVAGAAEANGFDAVLTPTGTYCEDAWISTAALSQIHRRLRYLVAFRPGTISPALAARQAATFQRHSNGRLLINIVTGGSDVEQRRFGDPLDKDGRYARCDEFLTIFKGVWDSPGFDFRGDHLWVEGGTIPTPTTRPEIYFGGSSDAALRVAAKHADVYLTWGEPPTKYLADHLDTVRELAAAAGRSVRFGIRFHVVGRETSAEAWQAADALLADVDAETIAHQQRAQAQSSAVGLQRMRALHQGDRDNLEIYPNVWAGIGLVRPGAGTALVGSYAEVASRLAEYHRKLGIDEFILSGYPCDEEAFHVGEGIVPELRKLGLVE